MKRAKKRFRRGQLKSELEKRIAKELTKSKHTVDYETTSLDYVIRKKYIPDFILTDKDGKITYLEVKGWLRVEDRIKLRAVKDTNPNVDLRLVFDKDNKLSKHSKMTYSEWAEKYGFPWVVGSVPKEWMR